jgi:hypothetical protein
LRHPYFQSIIYDYTFSKEAKMEEGKERGRAEIEEEKKMKYLNILNKYSISNYITERKTQEWIKL